MLGGAVKACAIEDLPGKVGMGGVRDDAAAVQFRRMLEEPGPSCFHHGLPCP